MRVNKLRKKLAGPKPLFGMAFYSQSLAIMEIIGHSGFDFVFIDCEHTPLGIDAQLENVLRAADYAGLGTVVRVKGNDEHMVRNALEFGADAVCVPHVRCAADAERAVSYGKFPPWGIRGAAGDVRSSHYGAGAFDWKGYVEQSNKDTIIVPLAEDREFFDNIDEILEVEGIDVINFGPADYSISRRISIDYSMSHPEVEEKLAELIEKCHARGIKVMAPCIPPVAENVVALKKKGVDMIIMGNDVMFLNQGLSRARDAIDTAAKSA